MNCECGAKSLCDGCEKDFDCLPDFGEGLATCSMVDGCYYGFAIVACPGFEPKKEVEE